MPSPRACWLARGLLIALVVAAFANGLGAGLIFDNRVIILEDTRIRAVTPGNVALILTRTYWWPHVATALYRPVTTLSYLVDYAVLGNRDHPAGYHVVNLLLHTVNVLLVFAIGTRLSQKVWLVFAVSAVWGVHPLLSESVTNIVGRADLLAATGLLGALWCHIRAGDSTGRRRAWWQVATAAAAVGGVFSKESAVAVVAVIPLWDLMIARRRVSDRSTWIAWLGLVPAVLLLVAARTAVLAGQPAAAVPFVDNPIAGAGWWTGRLTAVAVAADYLRLAIWPAALSCDYSFPQIPLVSGSAGDWLRWTAVCGVFAASFGLYRWSRALAMVVWTAMLTFVPASNLVVITGTIMAERIFYLPALGVVTVAVVAAWAAIQRARLPAWAAPALLATVVAALIAGTTARNRVWHDELSLWTAAAQTAPRSFKVHGALAEALYDADPSRANLPAVIAEKEQSLALLATLPHRWMAVEPYREAAAYYIERGDWLRAHPAADADAARAAYGSAARWAAFYLAAIDELPAGVDGPRAEDRAVAQLLLSTATLKAEDGGAAVAAARRGRLANPFTAAGYRAEAAALIGTQRLDDAAVTLLTGVIVTGDAGLRSAVLDLYRAGLDREGCAIAPGQPGAVLNPRCAVVRQHLCAASRDAIGLYTELRRPELADSARTAALQQFGCEGLP